LIFWSFSGNILGQRCLFVDCVVGGDGGTLISLVEEFDVIVWMILVPYQVKEVNLVMKRKDNLSIKCSHK